MQKKEVYKHSNENYYQNSLHLYNLCRLKGIVRNADAIHHTDKIIVR